ncbi:hypothetical protein D915_001145 [Fasciola hepatica]|uniref:CBM21 domain-containing protein n=1 Tax=Fasciola hepatica TaxID=6192 RepID=A0A4E0RML0_FASHE|nr:hypothetical protein D915_001145 [Fasciola hepatica]
MAATVGIRSGLSRHWTGSLLELNCSSTESLSDYQDSVENPFCVHWRADFTNGVENLHNPNGNGYVCFTHEEDVDGYVYSKDDMTRFEERENSGTTDLTNNQIFRLRQLISLLHRNFHHRYGKISRELPEKLTRSSFSTGEFNRSCDDSESTKTTNQHFMQSFGRSNTLSHDHKLMHALFDANLEYLFPNETSFRLLTKSKRRHCSSEGDLTFVNSTINACSSVQGERLLNSNSHLTSSARKSATVEENPGDLASDNSLKTLIEINDSAVRTEKGNTESETSLADQSLTDAVHVALRTFDTMGDRFECHTETQQDETDLRDSLTFFEEDESTQPEGGALTDPIKINHPDTIPDSVQTTLDATDNSSNGVVSHPRLTKSELSSPQVRKLERQGSNMSGSSGRLVKTVSFADEVGRSLTEVFLFRKTEEESLIPEYDDELDAPFISILRRPAASSFGRFTRSRNKRGFDEYLAFPYQQQTSGDTLSITNLNNAPSKTPEASRYLWFLGFTQPAAQYYEFRQRVENGCVSLENITLNQPEEYSQQQLHQQHHQQKWSPGNPTTSSRTCLPYLSGTIKVKNVHFDKKVWLRLTTNSWITFVDCPAVYNAQLSSGSSHTPSRFDTFTFQIAASDYPPEIENPKRIEFAIRYCAGPNSSCGEFWDNNEGGNYVIERRLVESTWSSLTNSSPLPLTKLDCSYSGCSDYSTHESNSTDSSTSNPYTVDYRPNFTGISSFTDYRAWEHYASESIYY